MTATLATHPPPTRSDSPRRRGPPAGRVRHARVAGHRGRREPPPARPQAAGRAAGRRRVGPPARHRLRAARRQAGLLRALQAVGVQPERDFALTEALALRVPPGLLRALSEDPDVVAISSDVPVTATGIASSVSGTAANSTYSMKATLGLASTTLHRRRRHGGGHRLGHRGGPDFDKRLVLTMDFTAGGKTRHGLGPLRARHPRRRHRRLAARATCRRWRRPSGSSASARWTPRLGLDQRRHQRHPVGGRQQGTYGIDILNLSLGHPVYEPAATDPLVQAVEAAVRAGIVVVVRPATSASRPADRPPGYGGITSPGNAPSAITVGAVRTPGHHPPDRRPGLRLQLARPDLVRRLRQARPRGPGPPRAVGGQHGLDALKNNPYLSSRRPPAPTCT